MADATETYQVRQASAEDLPAVLEVLAQNQAVAPKEAPPRPHAPSRRQRISWERMATTPGLAVYLAVHFPEDEEGAAQGRPVGTAAMVLMPQLTYDCHPHPRSSKQSSSPTPTAGAA
jgi:hypothetical protein